MEASTAASATTAPPPRPPPPCYFCQLSLHVDNAKLVSSSTALLKPNPYVEVVVDGKPPKKTDVAKATYQPRYEHPVKLSKYAQGHGS